MNTFYRSGNGIERFRLFSKTISSGINQNGAQSFSAIGAQAGWLHGGGPPLVVELDRNGLGGIGGVEPAVAGAAFDFDSAAFDLGLAYLPGDGV